MICWLSFCCFLKRLLFFKVFKSIQPLDEWQPSVLWPAWHLTTLSQQQTTLHADEQSLPHDAEWWLWNLDCLTPAQLMTVEAFPTLHSGVHCFAPGSCSHGTEGNMSKKTLRISQFALRIATRLKLKIIRINFIKNLMQHPPPKKLLGPMDLFLRYLQLLWLQEL